MQRRREGCHGTACFGSRRFDFLCRCDVCLIEVSLSVSRFHHPTYLDYKPPMKKFSNGGAKRSPNVSTNEGDQLRTAFKYTCPIILSMLERMPAKDFIRRRCVVRCFGGQ